MKNSRRKSFDQKDKTGHNDISIARQDSQLSNDLESPMGSFLSIDSEQSSKKEEDKYITSLMN